MTEILVLLGTYFYGLVICPILIVVMVSFPIVVPGVFIYYFIKEYRKCRKKGDSFWQTIKLIFASLNGSGNYTGICNPGYTYPHCHSATVYQNSATYATDSTYINMPQNIGYYRRSGY